MFKTKPHSAFARLLALITAVTIALPPSLPLAASPAMEKLFYILKQKGSITADEYDLLIQTMKDEEKGAPKASTPAPALEKRLTQAESKVENLESTLLSTKGQVEEISRVSDNTSPSTMSKTDLDALLSDKWYERIKLRGYVQTRFIGLIGDGDNPGVVQPNDPFVSDTQSLGIRRGRLVLSGDVTDHLYLYLQTDFMAGVGGVNALQARDVYADVSLDPAREFRVRLGLSKVPYGFSNLQSSQNRYALERPDALNSAVEGERDLGAYFIWAPYHIRNRYKDLVKAGLRGSGDYGVLNVGVYSGQGINNADRNGDMHYIARLAYPFEFDNGQILEVGASYYSGRYVPTTAGTFTPAGVAVTPNVIGGGGVRDSRVAINAILYPQPFGLEAEWTWGEGPQLSDDLRTISSAALSGGFVQAVYRHVFANQAELLPFVRWQHFDGARKFAANAPKNNVDEIAIGLEYIPYPELELTLMYARGSRTNTTDNPTVAGPRYRDVDYSYLGIQAQINF
ncbi:porin [Prosthecobacter sp.]|uniref:porin n=1 Tax=Prosthecobacter sp. TaxID=1965333 RepID=UPI002ABA8AC7|nr:porin [Prosthecobacter sp.]MDZ4402201.1 porin [Prosthecobacter sp.]